jgi:hypothetical protein
MEQIAHRIDEDHLRLAPEKRLTHPFGAELKVEAIFKRVASYSSKPFRETLGIAIIAASADFRATRHRIPCRISPFNCGSCPHWLAPRTK